MPPINHKNAYLMSLLREIHNIRIYNGKCDYFIIDSLIFHFDKLSNLLLLLLILFEIVNLNMIDTLLHFNEPLLSFIHAQLYIINLIQLKDDLFHTSIFDDHFLMMGVALGRVPGRYFFA